MYTGVLTCTICGGREFLTAKEKDSDITVTPHIPYSVSRGQTGFFLDPRFCKNCDYIILFER